MTGRELSAQERGAKKAISGQEEEHRKLSEVNQVRLSEKLITNTIETLRKKVKYFRDRKGFYDGNWQVSLTEL